VAVSRAASFSLSSLAIYERTGEYSSQMLFGKPFGAGVASRSKTVAAMHHHSYGRLSRRELADPRYSLEILNY
jgi:hypothetical protein